MNNIWYKASIVILIYIIIITNVNQCTQNNKNKLVYENILNNTIKKVKEKNGTISSITNVIQDNNTKTLLALKANDSTIKYLQDEIRRNKNMLKDIGSSIAVIISSTTFSESNSSIISKIDSIKKGNTIYYYPTYTSKSKDTTWINYDIVADKDNVDLKLKVKNKYSVIIGTEKISFFKRNTVVKVNNQNPYTDVKELKAFQIKDERKINRIGLGLQVGYGITLKGFSAYVGFGINFKII